MRPAPPGTPRWPRRGYLPPRRSGRANKVRDNDWVAASAEAAEAEKVVAAGTLMTAGMIRFSFTNP
jgi:hypothetical protein